MAKQSKPSTPTATEYGAFFNVEVPANTVYMPNVLQSFTNAIPKECYQYCTSTGYSTQPPVHQTRLFLQSYVEERLGKLADFEYRESINGRQPFVTPRELQLWRLRNFVQYVWFWNLPDDDDLAMIFNLTKRKAANLAADFIARFRKTLIYPVALRRLYYLINTNEPLKKQEKHKFDPAADGNVYKLDSGRLLISAQFLVDDFRSLLPTKRMANPYLWDREQLLMWIDTATVDVVKNNNDLKKRLFDMYEIPDEKV